MRAALRGCSRFRGDVMKKLMNSLVLAFAMYSGVPTPQADWKKENMRYVLCCFPLVGVLLGALCYAWSIVCTYLPVGQMLRTAVYVLLPVLVTGGIHLDGFLDTCDALHSYAPKERKLEILKDPRAGAFAVICGISLFVLNFGLWSQLSLRGVRSLSMGFVISRCLSGWSVAVFPCAKDTGLAATFQDAAHRRVVGAVCCLELLAVACIAFFVEPAGAACMLAAALPALLWYYFMSRRQFGGITGDLAGWFLQVCECFMAAAVMAGDMIWF